MREKVETMAQYKILVVDDNADILDLLEILLTSEGYAVTLASSGEQALQLLSPELDLVILDIMMPGISGIRVCEAIRKVSNVPVLFLTAKGTAGRRGRLSAQAFFPHPAHRAGQKPSAPVPGVSGQKHPGRGRMARARAAAHQPAL